MSIDLTTGCTRDERGHNFNCHKICQWCNREKDEIELEKLRDAMRWRKWPEEKPEETGRNPYTVILGCDCVQATFSSGRWLMDERMSFEDVADMVTHWRPIGELPGDTE